MAKKKKSKSKKKTSEPAASERSAFWPLSGAILLFILAGLMLIGGFGTGGSLPVGMFRAVYEALGAVAYLTPLALVFFGVLKFRSEDYQIPLGKFVAMFGFLASVAVAMHTMFVNGGYIGSVLGNAVLLALDKVPASLIFLVLAVLFFFLAFSISPKVLVSLLSPLKPKEKTRDTDLAELKAKSEHEFKLNEGVPMERPDSAEPAPRAPRLSSLKNTAQQLSGSENHVALTTASDPNWQFPSLDLLNQKQDKADAGDVQANAEVIRETFHNFNISVDMEGANVGPRVTQYTLKPPTNVKLTKITALENNLALDLAAHTIRMEAPIPGKRLVGIEVPNVKAATVRTGNLLASAQWQQASSPLEFVIGKDIAGQPVLADLAKLPHILVAGQTGSGKSVMINTILTSLLYRNSPADLKLILIDPKQVELKPYDDIPHLLAPVITEPEKCVSALKWTVAEMERRYKALSEVNRRNIVEYNKLKKEEGMPYIVVVIDELADLMMVAARDVESLIVRIAQKARAVGIHLVLATQRPSVDVITGLIKANVPARIAFTTTSQVDSRTIIDGVGAEKLLNRGDMLLKTSEMPKARRVQGALISDDETLKVTDFLREQRTPNYDDEIISQPVQLGKGSSVVDYGGQDGDDDLWRDAIKVVIEGGKASTSLLQRRLRVGYARAARLIENMEEQGIVGPADGARPREVLVSSMDDVFGSASPNPDGDVYDDMPDESEKTIS